MVAAPSGHDATPSLPSRPLEIESQHYNDTKRKETRYDITRSITCPSTCAVGRVPSESHYLAVRRSLDTLWGESDMTNAQGATAHRHNRVEEQAAQALDVLPLPHHFACGVVNIVWTCCNAARRMLSLSEAEAITDTRFDSSCASKTEPVNVTTNGFTTKASHEPPA